MFRYLLFRDRRHKYGRESKYMGLIRAAAGALGGTLADQWKEFFYCDAMDKDILVKRGRKRTSFRSANTKGNDNVISNGSGIAVADGQCMLIVEQGKVVEVCAEPGEFTYDSSTEPSIFTGNLGDSIKETFKIVGKRFTYGVTRRRISGFTTLTPRSLGKSCLEQQRRSRSALWWMSPLATSCLWISAATAYLLTRSAIRFCFIPMYAEMLRILMRAKKSRPA